MLKPAFLLAMLSGVVLLSGPVAAQPPAADTEAAPEAAPEVQAAPSPLASFPDEIAVLVRIKSPQKSVAGVSAFVGQINAQAALGVQFGWGGLVGGMLRNPGLTGIDLAADMYVGLHLKGQEEPGVLFGVRPTDVAKMKEAMFGDFTFAEKDGWVLYTEDPDVAKLLGGEVARDDSLGGSIPESARTLMTDHDFSVFVNLPKIRNEYAAEIQEGREQIEIMLDQLPALAPDTGIDMNMIADFYGKMIQGVMQGLDDAEGLSVGMSFDQDNMVLEDVFVSADGSKTSKFFAKHPTVPLASIDRLPADELVYFGFHGDLSEIQQSSLKMVAGMLPEDGGEAREAFEKLAEELKKVKLGETVGSLSLGSVEDGVLETVTLSKQGPADTVKKIAREFGPQMAQIQSGIPGAAKPGDYEFKIDGESYGDRKADVMRMKMNLDNVPDPTGMQKEMMEAFYGPDGITIRTIYLEDGTLQTMGGGRERMEAAVKAAFAETGSTRGYRTTREALVENANMVALVDLTRMIRDGARAFAETEQNLVPLDAEAIGGVNLPASYVGFAIATEKNGARGKFVLPVTTIKGMVKLFEQFEGLMPGQQF